MNDQFFLELRNGRKPIKAIFKQRNDLHRIFTHIQTLLAKKNNRKNKELRLNAEKL